MVEAELVEGMFEPVRSRRRRSAAERRLIVEETLEAGASVARVAQKYRINANQLFHWRRLYREGHLGAPPQSGIKLLPISVVEEAEAVKPIPVTDSAASAGAIHVELPGEVRISFEGKVDPATVRAVLDSLRA
jgi:transposase